MDPDQNTNPPAGDEPPRDPPRDPDEERRTQDDRDGGDGGSGDGGNGASLEAQVNQLREAMAGTQREKDAAEATMEQQRRQLEALTALLRDAERSRASYANEHPALKDKDQELRDYLRNERRCLGQVLGKLTEDVRDVVERHESELGRLETEQKEA